MSDERRSFISSHRTIIVVHFVCLAVAIWLKCGGATWIESLGSGPLHIEPEHCRRNLESDAISVAHAYWESGRPMQTGPTSFACEGQTLMITRQGDEWVLLCPVHGIAVRVQEHPPVPVVK